MSPMTIGIELIVAAVLGVIIARWGTRISISNAFLEGFRPGYRRGLLEREREVLDKALVSHQQNYY